MGGRKGGRAALRVSTGRRPKSPMARQHLPSADRYRGRNGDAMGGGIGIRFGPGTDGAQGRDGKTSSPAQPVGAAPIGGKPTGDRATTVDGGVRGADRLDASPVARVAATAAAVVAAPARLPRTTPLGLHHHALHSGESILLVARDADVLGPDHISVADWLEGLTVDSDALTRAVAAWRAVATGARPANEIDGRLLFEAFDEAPVADAVRATGFAPMEVATRLWFQAVRRTRPAEDFRAHAVATAAEFPRHRDRILFSVAYSAFDLGLDFSERLAAFQYLEAASFPIVHRVARYPDTDLDPAALRLDVPFPASDFFDAGSPYSIDTTRIHFVDALLAPTTPPAYTALGRAILEEPERIPECLTWMKKEMSAAEWAGVRYLAFAARYFDSAIEETPLTSESAFQFTDELIADLINSHPDADAGVQLLVDLQGTVAAQLTDHKRVPEQEIRTLMQEAPAVISWDAHIKAVAAALKATSQGASDGPALPPYSRLPSRDLDLWRLRPRGLRAMRESRFVFERLEALYAIENPYAKDQSTDPYVGTRTPTYAAEQADRHQRMQARYPSLSEVQAALDALSPIDGIVLEARDFSTNPLRFHHGTDAERADTFTVGERADAGRVRFCNPGQTPLLYGTELGRGFFISKPYDAYLRFAAVEGMGVVATFAQPMTQSDNVLPELAALYESIEPGAGASVLRRWFEYRVRASYGQTNYEDYLMNFQIDILAEILDTIDLPLDIIRAPKPGWTFTPPGPVLDALRVERRRDGDVGYPQFNKYGHYAPLSRMTEAWFWPQSFDGPAEHLDAILSALPLLSEDAGEAGLEREVARDGEGLILAMRALAKKAGRDPDHVVNEALAACPALAAARPRPQAGGD